ncbi:MAG: alpha-L-arabinofuranosidase, partial [Clostridia bacterium]|nr:alpha-L-arabinofuranosidase [Clostridia bacterium]
MDIKINTKNKLNTISPLLIGAFFEDINYGGDGGLYAELVANRSFEYYDRDNIADKHKMCWEPLIGTRFEICSESPINDIHTHYAAVNGGVGAGIRNTGYGNEGFASKEGDTFLFSCYARAKQPVKLAAVIADRTGRAIGRADFECCGQWHKYETEITVSEAEAHALLSVILPDGGAAELEFVSLFPKDTFKGRRNGMRRDIAELIADMKPKFLRFPGGCIVEGRSFENMYNWKDTIGPVEMRKTNHNRWQYEEYKNLGFDASDYF